MKKFILLLMLVSGLGYSCTHAEGEKKGKTETPFEIPKGNLAFCDPVQGAPTDPVMVWNHKEKKWFIYYTQRRGYLEMDDPQSVEWVHGTSVGIASSPDGKEWTYRGTCKGDEGMSNDPVSTSWWAPEVISVDNTFHMYVTNVPGVFKTWNAPRFIKHFISEDGINWKYQSTLSLSSKSCIDAGVHKVGDKWYLWYKDETQDAGRTWFAESPDLYNWKVVGPAITDRVHEAPFVWEYDNKYWMIVDTWGDGSRIYKSDDGLTNWTYSCNIWAPHPAIYIINDKLYVVHHNGINRTKLSVIQIAELEYKNGIFIKKEK